MITVEQFRKLNRCELKMALPLCPLDKLPCGVKFCGLVKECNYRRLWLAAKRSEVVLQRLVGRGKDKMNTEEMGELAHVPEDELQKEADELDKAVKGSKATLAQANRLADIRRILARIGAVRFNKSW